MWKFEQWKQLLDGGDEALQRMYTEGAAILRAHEQNVQAVVKGARRACVISLTLYGERLQGLELSDEIRKMPGLSANCPPHLTSDVGHELATQSGTFGLCWYLGREGTTAKCSLRSNGEYDVSAIAKAFGGGGHRNAAGFEVEISTLLSWLK